MLSETAYLRQRQSFRWNLRQNGFLFFVVSIRFYYMTVLFLTKPGGLDYPAFYISLIFLSFLREFK